MGLFNSIVRDAKRGQAARRVTAVPTTPALAEPVFAKPAVKTAKATEQATAATPAPAVEQPETRTPISETVVQKAPDAAKQTAGIHPLVEPDQVPPQVAIIPPVVVPPANLQTEAERSPAAPRAPEPRNEARKLTSTQPITQQQTTPAKPRLPQPATPVAQPKLAPVKVEAEAESRSTTAEPTFALNLEIAETAASAKPPEITAVVERAQPPEVRVISEPTADPASTLVQVVEIPVPPPTREPQAVTESAPPPQTMNRQSTPDKTEPALPRVQIGTIDITLIQAPKTPATTTSQPRNQGLNLSRSYLRSL